MGIGHNTVWIILKIDRDTGIPADTAVLAPDDARRALRFTSLHAAIQYIERSPEYASREYWPIEVRG